jgi:hypothetical protein
MAKNMVKMPLLASLLSSSAAKNLPLAYGRPNITKGRISEILTITIDQTP